MGLLESLGGLTIFAIIIMITLYIIELQSKKDRETRLIRENYSKIKNIETEITIAKITGKTVPNPEETYQKIKNILNDPNERAKALEEIMQKQLSDEESKYKFKQLMKNYRKFAFKFGYDEMLFRIFYIKYSLTRDEVITGIMKDKNIDLYEAEQLYNAFKDKFIVDELNSNHVQLSTVLTDPEYKLTDSDLTQDEWINANKKHLP